MRAAVITFPGSNCDRDLVRGFALAGFETVSVWHKETSLPSGIDVVGLPGGFSYGDGPGRRTGRRDHLQHRRLKQ